MMIMMMITRGGGRRWRQPGSAQMHEKRACIEIMQRSSLTVEVLITSPLNAFCQSSVCKVLLLFLFQSLAMCRGFRHPEALNTCCHFSRILTELVSSQGEQNLILTAVLTKLWFNSSIHGEKNKQTKWTLQRPAQAVSRVWVSRTNQRDSKRVKGNTTSTRLCTCDARGCPENKERPVSGTSPLQVFRLRLKCEVFLAWGVSSSRKVFHRQVWTSYDGKDMHNLWERATRRLYCK